MRGSVDTAPAEERLPRLLKAARALADLSTEELARAMDRRGLGVGPLKAMEQGRRWAERGELALIANTCGVSSDFFYRRFDGDDSIGQRIRRVRETQGLTTRELERRTRDAFGSLDWKLAANDPPPLAAFEEGEGDHVEGWEGDEIAISSLDLEALAVALAVDVDDLVPDGRHAMQARLDDEIARLKRERAEAVAERDRALLEAGHRAEEAAAVARQLEVASDNLARSMRLAEMNAERARALELREQLADAKAAVSRTGQRWTAIQAALAAVRAKADAAPDDETLADLRDSMAKELDEVGAAMAIEAEAAGNLQRVAFAETERVLARMRERGEIGDEPLPRIGIDDAYALGLTEEPVGVGLAALVEDLAGAKSRYEVLGEISAAGDHRAAALVGDALSELIRAQAALEEMIRAYERFGPGDDDALRDARAQLEAAQQLSADDASRAKRDLLDLLEERVERGSPPPKPSERPPASPPRRGRRREAS